MLNKNYSFDLNEVLLPNIAIKSLVNELYRIGLSHYRFGNKNRSKLYNPYLVFTITSIVWFKFILLLIIIPESNDMSIIFGDYSYFLGIRIQFNLFFYLLYLMTLISQIYHYWYYKHNIYPTYMKPFLMISGIVSPKSIGLTDKQDILKLLKFTKSFLFVSKIIFSVLPSIGFIISFYPLALNNTLPQLILYSIPWSLLLSYSATCAARINIWQMIYFTIICYYLKIKLISIIKNKNQLRMFGSYRMRNINIIKILKTLQSIHREIKEYNNNYWSQFLFWLCITFIPINALLIYQIIFAKINIIMRLLYIYAAIFIISMLYFPLNTASSLSTEANNLHKVMIGIFLRNNKYLNFHIKLKV